MKQKHTYTTPTVDALVVQAESVICESAVNPTTLLLFSDWGISNAAGAEMIEDKGYDL